MKDSQNIVRAVRAVHGDKTVIDGASLWTALLSALGGMDPLLSQNESELRRSSFQDFRIYWFLRSPHFAGISETQNPGTLNKLYNKLDPPSDLLPSLFLGPQDDDHGQSQIAGGGCQASLGPRWSLPRPLQTTRRQPLRSRPHQRTMLVATGLLSPA